MGIITASIQFKESLEEVKYQIESLEDPIKDISDDEQRGYLKALFDQLNQAKEELYQSSINLLNEIDKIYNLG